MIITLFILILSVKSELFMQCAELITKNEELKRVITQLKERLDNIIDEKEKLNVTLTQKSELYDVLENMKNDLVSQNIKLKNEVKILNNKNAELNDKLSKQNSMNVRLTNSVQTLETTIKKLNNKIEKAKSKIRDVYHLWD